MSRDVVLRTVADLCSDDHVVRSKGPHDVVEPKKKGQGRVTLDLADSVIVVTLRKQPGGFSFLKSSREADGAMLLFRDAAGAALALSVELKSKLSTNELGKALEQLRQSTTRLLALAAAVGAPIAAHQWVVAYSTDDVRGRAEPADLRRPIDSGSAPAPDTADATWRRGYTHERFGRVAVAKVPRDPLGNAIVDLKSI